MLPKPMRDLGDSYARNEFRAHGKLEHAAFAPAFFREWQQYLNQIHSITGQSKPALNFDAFTDGQIAQLYELRQAAKGDPTTNDNKKTPETKRDTS